MTFLLDKYLLDMGYVPTTARLPVGCSTPRPTTPPYNLCAEQKLSHILHLTFKYEERTGLYRLLPAAQSWQNLNIGNPQILIS